MDDKSLKKIAQKLLESKTFLSSDDKLALGSFKRQQQSAGLILAKAIKEKSGGVLLADDVGLGKTMVAILVAYAFAKSDGKVLIAVPNKKLKSKWLKELKYWIKLAPDPLPEDNIIGWEIENERLAAGKIFVATTTELLDSDIRRTQDLLILDEAHRDQNPDEGKRASRIFKLLCNQQPNTIWRFRVFLTATPLRIKISGLKSILRMVRGIDPQKEDEDELDLALLEFDRSKKLKVDSNSADFCSTFISIKEKLAPHIIRHHIENISSDERKNLGQTRHILGNLRCFVDNSDSDCFAKIEEDAGASLVNNEDGLECTEQAAEFFTRFFRMAVLANAYDSIAQKTASLNFEYLKSKAERLRLNQTTNSRFNAHFNRFAELSELSEIQTKQNDLRIFAKKCFEIGEKFVVFCYHHETADAVHQALLKIWYETKDISRPECNANQREIRSIPELPHVSDERVRELFNSPDNPAALVLTNTHSEGIDLHLHCRILVHYELTYSPHELIQRNGRLRRVNSFGAKEGKPILYFYPYLSNTRDEQLVKIVIERANTFNRLMGGLPVMPEDSNELLKELLKVKVDFDNESFRTKNGLF